MKPIAIFLTVLSLAAISVLVFVITRRPTVQAGIRDTGKDIQRGAREAYDGTKDAAEDATDAIKDATR
jgi:hypothetical protein